MAYAYIFCISSSFSTLFALPIGVKMGSKSMHDHFVFVVKVRKTPDFDKKSGVFMVAEAGLEPTTSGL